jgi:hypothetical protein
VATYYDNREKKEKTVPNCARHGLVWDSVSQRCKRIAGLGYLDEYSTDLFLDSGYGFYELPYYEPVYYEPEPVYYELPPPPVPIPEPIVYQPAPTPIYQAPEPVYFELPYVEQVSPIAALVSDQTVYVPPPIVAPVFEYEPIKEEFFGLPHEGFEPAPIPIAVTHEPVIEAKPMAEDFYTDDYYGGDFYDGGYSYTGDVSFLTNGGGGGSDYYAPVDDFYYGYGFDSPVAPIDYAPLPMPEYEPLPYVEPIDLDFFGLPPAPLPDLPIYQQEEFFPVLPFTPLPDVGFIEPLPPIELFPEVIQMETEPSQAPIETPVILPELAPAPFVPTPIDLDPFGDFFELPYVPLPEAPPPPPGKLGPCDTPNGLPGVCPQGQYHPQANPCECVPFPPATTQTQQPKPPTGQQQPTTAPKPPTTAPQQQQQAPQVCPTGYCKHPQTGQCMQIPYGYARHPQTQICVLASQQTSPIPSEVETAFDDIKKLPWWVWAAGVGLVLLSGRGR